MVELRSMYLIWTLYILDPYPLAGGDLKKCNLHLALYIYLEKCNLHLLGFL